VSVGTLPQRRQHALDQHQIAERDAGARLVAECGFDVAFGFALADERNVAFLAARLRVALVPEKEMRDGTQLPPERRIRHVHLELVGAREGQPVAHDRFFQSLIVERQEMRSDPGLFRHSRHRRPDPRQHGLP
jgi:hypothetical protein